MADNADMKALVKAQETQAKAGDLVDEYIRLTLAAEGNLDPTGDDIWHAQEGSAKLFRANLESGDSETIQRALNSLVELRKSAKKAEKDGVHGKRGADGAMSAASLETPNAAGDHDVSPDKPTRSDHGRSQYDQDPQRDIQKRQQEPKHPQVPDEHPHSKKGESEHPKKHK